MSNVTLELNKNFIETNTSVLPEPFCYQVAKIHDGKNSKSHLSTLSAMLDVTLQLKTDGKLIRMFLLVVLERKKVGTIVKQRLG